MSKKVKFEKTPDQFFNWIPGNLEALFESMADEVRETTLETYRVEIYELIARLKKIQKHYEKNRHYKPVRQRVRNI